MHKVFRQAIITFKNLEQRKETSYNFHTNIWFSISMINHLEMIWHFCVPIIFEILDLEYRNLRLKQLFRPTFCFKTMIVSFCAAPV